MLGFNKGALLAVLSLLLYQFFPSGAFASNRAMQNTSPASENLRRILLLNSYHQGYPWSDRLVPAVKKKISADFSSYEVYVEYMDSKRKFNSRTMELIKKMLREKYQNVKVDVIITSDDNALSFMRKYHDELFPGVPVVFCGINDFKQALTAPREIYTGLIETIDTKPNIELILRLCPNAKKIYIISDATPTGLNFRKQIKAITKLFPQIKFEILKGEELTTSELLKRLKKVKPSDAVLMTLWFRDKTGRYFSQKSIIPVLSRNTLAPIFGMVNYHTNLGVLGGKMNSGMIQGRYAGEMAVRIMHGESPKNIPIMTESVNEYIFSWTQLQRFGISEEQLPDGSEIINRPFSFYRTYKKLVWTVTGTFCVFLLLVIFLTINSIRLQRAKHQLVSSEKNLEIILNSIGDAVIATDLNGNILRMNPVAETLSGWNKTKAYNHNYNEVFPQLSPDDRHQVSFSLEEMLQTQTSLNAKKYFLLVREGSEKLIATGYSPIRDDQNKTVGLVIVLRDITEEAALQERLHQSERLQSVGMLAGGIAHDFNNMLAGIFGATEVLSTKVETEQEKKLVHIVLDSAERASLLTSKLLIFSRKGKTVFAPADINDVIKNTVSLLEHTIDKKITISSTMKATSSTINGDESQLQNVFINMGINASHAMQNGGNLDFSTRNIQLDENYCSESSFDISPGNYIEIEIRDTGTGILPEHINKIFEPFFTTKEQGKGTGLGLSAVYGTVQSHHGAITVYSEVGTGTVFRLYFPLTEQKLTSLTANDESVFTGEGTILIVDDEQMIRSIAATILQDVGYKTLLAENGEEAVDIYKENSGKIDLVIMDMIMPKLNGIDAFEKLKVLNPDVKVLISSGFSKEGDLEKLTENGVQGFIRKPYRKVELCRRVAELI